MNGQEQGFGNNSCGSELSSVTSDLEYIVSLSLSSPIWKKCRWWVCMRLLQGFNAIIDMGGKGSTWHAVSAHETNANSFREADWGVMCPFGHM